MAVGLSESSRKLVSIFSGCGGFDAGFKAAGFSPTAAFDFDSVAIDHYRKNISPEAHVVDLAKEFPSSSEITSPAVLIAGPPCQGFSTVGKRDIEDIRNHLLPLTADIALRLSPKVLVVENVSAAKSGAHAKYWKALDSKLREAGYWTNSILCDAADIGMAQQRRRHFMFAWKTGKTANFSLLKVPRSRLDIVLSGVESQENHSPTPLTHGSRLCRISERIGPGQKLSNVRGGPRSVHTWHIPEVFGATTAAECAILEAIMRIRRAERRREFGDADPVAISRLISEFGTCSEKLIGSLLQKKYLRSIGIYVDLSHTFNGKVRRFRWDDISCTVDTRFGDPHLFLHPNEHRPFTVREAARIQGFSDGYSFFGKEKDHFRLIGNAVPPPMAQAIATVVKQLLLT